METSQEPTVREALEQAYDKVIAPEVAPEAGADAAEVVVAEREQRARDEAGRFAKQEAKPEVKPEAKPEAKPEPEVKAERFGIKRPDSWKKELWPIWDKLDSGQALTREEQKAFLEYIPHREGEYQKGVSTYKQEWENARPLLEAVTPYQPFLAQHKIKPEQFVAALAQTDQTLRFGTPQQKLATFVRFAQDYQIPLNEMFVKGDDGQVYFNQQYMQPQQQASQGLTAQDVERLVGQRLQQAQIVAAVQQFKEAKDGEGKPLYPHFDEVRQTMDGLLRSGLATDLAGAYHSALRMPQHQSIYDAQQTAKREAEELAKKREESEKAERARQKAVSARTSSPTGPSGGNGKASIRELLEHAYDKHVTGRV
jgi:hypothetical protein